MSHSALVYHIVRACAPLLRRNLGQETAPGAIIQIDHTIPHHTIPHHTIPYHRFYRNTKVKRPQLLTTTKYTPLPVSHVCMFPNSSNERNLRNGHIVCSIYQDSSAKILGVPGINISPECLTNPLQSGSSYKSSTRLRGAHKWRLCFENFAVNKGFPFPICLLDSQSHH